jgi:putative heme-binding domain-containing protein
MKKANRKIQFTLVAILAAFSALRSCPESRLSVSLAGSTEQNHGSVGAVTAPTASDGKRGSHPLEVRVPWTASRIRGTPEPPPPYRTERVFPKIHFKNPTVITSAPGSDRVFVAEQTGTLYSIPNDLDCDRADVFLDLRKEIRTIDPAGPAKTVGDCYGLAFHPRFEQNRYCYVCYIVNGESPNDPLSDGSRVSRFRVTETDPPRCDPASEEIIITWLGGGHNGGCLAFGPDGYLYISTGDAAGPNPPDILNAGQDMTRLLSGILRIDVDRQEGGRRYAIPPDNPFVSLPGARAEKWAYGFRNPWKMSFDRATGDLWVGDVGWELWEMIYRIERGGNYGWSIMEGPQPVKPEGQRGPTPILPPAIALAHSEAASITGGYVYRGQKLKELQGAYIFGDWETRRLWAARWDGSKVTSRQDLAEPTLRIVAFGEDNEGELLIVDYDDGTIHQLVPNQADQVSHEFPRRLSDSGLFERVDQHRPAAGVIPFSINAEQWADNATAERLLGLPGQSSITVHKQAIPVVGTIMQTNLAWPADAVLAKTVSLELERGRPESRRRIETQILHYDGKSWRAYSYRWNDDQTDAVLVAAEGLDQVFHMVDPGAPGGRRRLAYNFASRATCMRCHNPWAQHTLAFNLAQLNRDCELGGDMRNQVHALEQLGILVHAATQATEQALVPTRHEPRQPVIALVDPYDGSANIDHRARSYLQVNCAHCHQLGAGGTAEIDLRFTMPIEQTKALGIRPVHGTFGIHDSHIVSPGDPFRSVLFYRMSKVGGGRMPHIGSEVIDARGIQLVHDWIRQLRAPSTEAAAIDRLGNLTHESGDGSHEGAQRRADAINQLLANTSGALRLAYAIERGELPAVVRDQAITAGVASAESQIRDLFEKFLPDDRRSQRLGSVVRPEKLLADSGDAARGRELFLATPTVACKNCHKIASIGSDLGPDLTHIGTKYTKAQILESILEPSKFIDPKYILHLVETTEGRVLTGLLVEKNAESVVLRDAQDKVVRIPAAEVEQCVPQRQSIMPELLLRDLTEQQVTDLLEFLAALK